jgi:hypothetical protein
MAENIEIQVTGSLKWAGGVSLAVYSISLYIFSASCTLYIGCVLGIQIQIFRVFVCERIYPRIY